MCILFAFVNPKPKNGQFKVILASNRDELYARPAKKAHFCDSIPKVIAGKMKTGCC